MIALARLAVLVAPLAPLVAALLIGLRLLLADRSPSERTVTRVIGTGLVLSLVATLTLLVAWTGLLAAPVQGDVPFAEWLRLGDFVMLTVFRVDGLSVTLAVFAAVTTALVARFSRTYLHREPGFLRFFTLLGLFAAGTQLVVLAGALELFFAGWELIGIASAFFIGFFHERAEPVRSSIRAFATYRLSDAGLLIATVATFEFLGSTRFSGLAAAAALPASDATLLALLFLLSAMGKSAQLPFSGWLPRAMEGPTPSSALFYGAVSIHAGLFLLLRIWPLLAVSPVAQGIGVAVGLATAVYAAGVARVHTDAKGALAHATLAQVGLILAEIALGWTTLAVVHLMCHAFLRLGQYLKAPSTIHDSHRLGHAGGAHAHGPSWITRTAPALVRRLYAAALHRLRLDDRIDLATAPVLALAHALDAVDRRLATWLGAMPTAPREGGADGPPRPSPALSRALAVTVALTAVVTLRAERGEVAYAAVAVGALMHSAASWRATRTGASVLAASALLTGIAAADLAAGQLEAAFLASLLAVGLRVGLMPFNAGTSALINASPALHTQQLATTVVLVFTHLRFVDHHEAAVALAPLVVRYGAAAAVAGALLAVVQRDLRGFFRATTAMHAGMLISALGAASLGFFAAALLVAVAMALALGGLGLMVSALEARVGPVSFAAPGGRAAAFPRLAAAFALFGGAGVAMPGTAGFVADDLLLHTLWTESPASTWAVIIASALLAVATLVAVARVFLGPGTPSRAPDLHPVERLAAAAVLVVLAGLGVLPGLLLGPADAWLRVVP